MHIDYRARGDVADTGNTSLAPEAVKMVTGTVKWFDSKKGFGFITHETTDGDIFVHYSSILGEGFRSLKDGDVVEFDLVKSDKGLQAHQVRRATPVVG